MINFIYTIFNILFVHNLFFFCLFVLGVFCPDDYIAIGADCDELGAQIEEYILFSGCQGVVTVF